MLWQNALRTDSGDQIAGLGALLEGDLDTVDATVAIVEKSVVVPEPVGDGNAAGDREVTCEPGTGEAEGLV